jgi:hypothetical protein
MQGSHVWRGGSALLNEEQSRVARWPGAADGVGRKAGLSALLDKHVRFTSERVTSGAANATPKLIITGMAGGAGRYR